MSDEVWDDPEAKAWARRVVTEMVPSLRASAVSISLVPHNEGDVKFWVELGASIMLGKPILVVALKGRQIPPKLRLVADEIVELPDGLTTPGASDAVARAIERMATR